jgi:hypothetical protein
MNDLLCGRAGLTAAQAHPAGAIQPGKVEKFKSQPLR